MRSPALRIFSVKGGIPIIREIREELRCSEAYAVYSQCMYRPSPEKYAFLIDGYLNCPSVCAFGFFSGSRLTGILILDRKEILGIAVRPDMQNLGIGRSLIFHAAEALNLSRLTAETDGDAVDFYQACGFECTRFERAFPAGVSVRYNCIINF